MHFSVMNGALWDMEQVHSGIYEIGLLGGTEQHKHDKYETLA